MDTWIYEIYESLEIRESLEFHEFLEDDEYLVIHASLEFCI